MPFDVKLYPPNITVILSNSVMNLSLGENKEWAFGTVYQINLNTTQTAVGEPVIFNKTESVLVTQETRSYFIVDERKLLLQETVEIEP